MKIIGKTAAGYLVEITEREIAMSLGFDWESDKEFRVHTEGARDQYGNREGLKIGAEIQMRQSHEYLQHLRNKETTVKTAAKILRELAEMMEAGVPTAIVPPPEQGKSGGD
jgi:hypothetical protein